jgi:hypothetical protein
MFYNLSKEAMKYGLHRSCNDGCCAEYNCHGDKFAIYPLLDRKGLHVCAFHRAKPGADGNDTSLLAAHPCALVLFSSVQVISNKQASSRLVHKPSNKKASTNMNSQCALSV